MSRLLLVLGCSWFEPELALDSVQPTELRVGSELRVVGAGFTSELSAVLQSEGVDWPLEGVVVVDPTHFGARVPEVDPGRYHLVVVRGEQSVRFPLQVRAEVREKPCDRGYQANTEVSLATGIATIDRFYDDGKRDRIQTPIGEIERLEYTVWLRDGAAPCASIVLRRTDGDPVLFEDAEGDLKARAETLAKYMQKELVFAPTPERAPSEAVPRN
ncbi:MAG: hypothetical protein R3F61_07335 [Myxococcota bacterium]